MTSPGTRKPYPACMSGEACVSVSSPGGTTRRRDVHTERWDGLVRDFRSLGCEPVAVHTHDLGEMLGAFLRWADRASEASMLRRRLSPVAARTVAAS